MVFVFSAWENAWGRFWYVFYEYEKKSEIKGDDTIFKNDTPYNAGIFRSLALHNDFELKYNEYVQ